MQGGQEKWGLQRVAKATRLRGLRFGILLELFLFRTWLGISGSHNDN